MIRSATVAFAIVVSSGCAPRDALAQPSPPSTQPSTASAAPSITPAATDSPSASSLPGSSVRISVNGQEVNPANTYTLTGGPTTVVLAFPVDMDRATVEQFLPRSATPTWNDDRTLTLVIPATESNPAFKVGFAQSKDHRVTIDFFVVNLANPPSAVLSTYSVSELLAGRQPPKPDAPRIPVARGATVVPSPDSKQLLLALLGAPSISFARVVDLASGRVQSLVLPGGSLTLGGWAGSDRIVVVADRVWIVPVDGAAPRQVADISQIGAPTSAAVSPDGRNVAVASGNRLAVVSVADGAMRPLANVATCPAMTLSAPGLAWSSDSKRLALSDCATLFSDEVQTRILEVGTAATVTVIRGGVAGISSTLSGDLLVSRDSGIRGEGARTLWVLFSFSGDEKTRLLGYRPTLSPDGKYVLDGTCCAGEGFTLTPLGADPDRATAGSAVWLPDGRVVAMTR